MGGVVGGGGGAGDRCHDAAELGTEELCVLENVSLTVSTETWMQGNNSKQFQATTSRRESGATERENEGNEVECRMTSMDEVTPAAPSASPPLCTLADTVPSDWSTRLLVDQLIEDAGGRRAFADLVASELRRPVRRVRYLPPTHWPAERLAARQHLLDELLSAHPSDRQDSILCLRTHGYHYPDLSNAVQQTRQYGVEYARAHARWWKRPWPVTELTRQWAYCDYAAVATLVELPETDSFEARFHRIYCRVYHLHQGQCVDPLPRSRHGRWYRADDGLPEDGRPLDNSSISSSGTLSQSSLDASQPPLLSGSQLEQLYDDDDSSGSDQHDEDSSIMTQSHLQSSSSSLSQSHSSSSCSSLLPPRPLLPLRDPSVWCTLGVFVGSDVCPSVPLWVPLLANQHELQPLSLQVPYRHMMNALGASTSPPTPARLFHCRVVQRVHPLHPAVSRRPRCGPVRFVCEDVSRSYGVALTDAQWRVWFPDIIRVHTEEEGVAGSWMTCLSRSQLKQHVQRVQATSSAAATAHPSFGPAAHTVATFLQAARRGSALLAHCVPRPQGATNSSPTSHDHVQAPRPHLVLLSTLPNAAVHMSTALAAAAAGGNQSLWPYDPHEMPDSVWGLTPPPSPTAAAEAEAACAAPPALSLEVDFVAHLSPTLPAVIVCHRTPGLVASAAAAAARPRPHPRLRTPPRCLDEEEQEHGRGEESPTAKRVRTASPPPRPRSPAVAPTSASPMMVMHSSRPRLPPVTVAAASSSPSSLLNDNDEGRVHSPLLELECECEQLTQEQASEVDVDLDFEFD